MIEHWLIAVMPYTLSEDRIPFGFVYMEMNQSLSQQIKMAHELICDRKDLSSVSISAPPGILIDIDWVYDISEREDGFHDSTPLLFKRTRLDAVSVLNFEPSVPLELKKVCTPMLRIERNSFIVEIFTHPIDVFFADVVFRSARIGYDKLITK